MKLSHSLAAVLLSLSLPACNQQDTAEQITPDLNQVRVDVLPFHPVRSQSPVTGSRTDISIQSDGAHFAWNVTDSLGVFPQNGYQTAFSLSETDGEGAALFGGGSWRLRPEAQYAAYYPFTGEAYHQSAEALCVGYFGQRQSGNGQLSHLPAFDYLACPFKKADPNSGVQFQMRHLGSLVLLVFKAPTADTWQSVRVKSLDGQFVGEGTFSLRSAQPAITATSTSDTLRLDLEHVFSTAADDEITVGLMMCAATEMHDWAFTLRGETGATYRDTVHYEKSIAPGMCYRRTVTFDGTANDDWAVPISEGGSVDPNLPILAPGMVGFSTAVYPFDEVLSSRMEMQEAGNITFVWSRNDTLGVFPRNDNQTAFPVSSQAGASLALFDGHDWALRDGCQYAAYYPFSARNFHQSPTQLPVSFEGQVLDGANPTRNAGRYNYCAAALTQVNSDDPIKFVMKGLGTIVKLSLQCPRSDRFSELVLADGQHGIAHQANYNLMESAPRLSAAPEYHESLSFKLVNYSASDSLQNLDFYLMLMPEEHESLCVRLVGERAVYEGFCNRQNLTPGTAKHIKIALNPAEDWGQNNPNPTDK